MLSIAALQAFTHPRDVVSWLNPLSLACFFAFFRLRQAGESRWVYLANPRALFTNLAALSVLVTGVWNSVRMVR